MEKKVLFICESAESFLVSTMIKNIKAAGYEVIYSSPNLRKITKISELPNLIVVYLDGDDTKYQETLEYLAKIKNSGANLSTHVFLIGNPIETSQTWGLPVC